MVAISIIDGRLRVEPLGASKVWTLKGRLEFPMSEVDEARLGDPQAVKTWWPGLRMPGTHLPGIILAGSYWRWGGWEFWDVRKGNEPIEIRLKHGKFRRLVVDVADPEATLETINRELGESA